MSCARVWPDPTLTLRRRRGRVLLVRRRNRARWPGAIPGSIRVMDCRDSAMKSAAELLEAELIEMRRIDQKFLSAGFSQEWVKLLHSEILIAVGLEDDIESVE